MVPVYAGLSETLICLHSVLSSEPSSRVVVVDDATPDSRLAAALDELADACDRDDADRAIALIRRQVPEYRPPDVEWPTAASG